jgi:hypothetical protein
LAIDIGVLSDIDPPWIITLDSSASSPVHMPSQAGRSGTEGRPA